MTDAGDFKATAAKLAEVAARLGDRVVPDVPLNRNPGYGIGGPAALLAACQTDDDVLAVSAAIASIKVPTALIGRATNLLIADRGIQGIVLTLKGEFTGHRIVEGGASIVVGGGASLPSLAEDCNVHGLSGIEWAVGIPGTAGGAVAMNAGVGIGNEMRDVVVDCDVLDLTTGTIERWNNNRCGFYHRGSALSSHHVVLRLTLNLIEDDPAKCLARSREAHDYRRKTQPLQRTTGSVFSTQDAWRTIVEAGYRGYTFRSAKISRKHANFIVVDATYGLAADVLELMCQIRHGVYNRLGTLLEVETRMFGFRQAELERLHVPD